MKTKSFTTSFMVEQSPHEVFEAINNVRAWWPGTLEGRTDALGAEFTYRFEDFHHSTQKITEFIPGRRVTWHVSRSKINFVKDKDEWTGTDMVFDIGRKDGQTELRFTHRGLVPILQCYEGCSGAWDTYVGNSLRDLITTGKARPDLNGH